MIVHHDQGVLMAHYAEQNTTDPEIGVMAYDIGYTQTDQIGQMQGWLSLWDLPESGDGTRMGWMGGTAAAHGGWPWPPPQRVSPPTETAPHSVRRIRAAGRGALGRRSCSRSADAGHGHRRRDREAQGR